MRGRAARISPYDFGFFEASHRIWQGMAVLADAPHSAAVLKHDVIGPIAISRGSEAGRTQGERHAAVLSGYGIATSGCLLIEVKRPLLLRCGNFGF
jgi:hypothetical protein